MIYVSNMEIYIFMLLKAVMLLKYIKHQFLGLRIKQL